VPQVTPAPPLTPRKWIFASMDFTSAAAASTQVLTKKLRKGARQSELVIRIDLHQGKADAWVWTCDFTHEYIRINASRS